MTMIPVAMLRNGVDRLVSRMFRSLDGPASSPVPAVVAGRLLLGVCGTGVLGFAPLLGLDRRTCMALAVVSACMIAVLAVSFTVAWTRLPPSATLLFPALVCAALAALGMFASPGFVTPFTGMLTLCFAYVGLTQAPGTAVLCLPVAAATFLSAYQAISAPITARLIIAFFVWSVLAELLARLTRRQAALTATLAGEARYDELTGVPNRRDLDARLLAAGPGDTLAMCDLDHFKDVNDTLGHAAGDRVLAEFGAVLRVMLRSDDYCARYGGEEFLLILHNSSSEQVSALLTRLRQQWATLQPSVTFSAGVATCTRNRSTAQTLAMADAMLYAAKAAGRDRDVLETDVLAGTAVPAAPYVA